MVILVLSYRVVSSVCHRDTFIFSGCSWGLLPPILFICCIIALTPVIPLSFLSLSPVYGGMMLVYVVYVGCVGASLSMVSIIEYSVCCVYRMYLCIVLYM